jgi:septal ring factor EnvC (AmiA/AmiB activator)
MRNKTLEARLAEHKRNVDDLVRRVKAGHMRTAGVAAEIVQLGNEIMELHSAITTQRERKPRKSAETQENPHIDNTTRVDAEDAQDER